MLGFLGLGENILVLIMSLLHPRDIRSLRLISKELFEISRKRIVWIRALRRVMKEEAVPLEITYPIETMSSALLEHVASSPYRFISLLQNAIPNTVLNPRNIRTLVRNLTREEREAYLVIEAPTINFISTYPAHGGRYLFTLSEHHKETAEISIELWDVGLRGDERPKLLACMTIPEVYDADMPPIVYAVLVNSESPYLPPVLHTPYRNGFKLFILEINPSMRSPKFRAVERAERDDTSRFSVTWDRIVFLCDDGTVVISNFESKQSVQFKISNELFTPSGPEIFSYSDSLILSSPDDIAIFSIPSNDLVGNDEICAPSLIVPTPMEFQQGLYGSLPQTDVWYPDHQYIVKMVGQHVIINQIKASDAGNGSVLPTQIAALQLPQEECLAMDRCDNFLIFTWLYRCEPPQFRTSVIPVESLGSTLELPMSVILRTVGLPTSHQTYISPVSGRLFMCTYDNHVHIIDFLEPFVD